MIDLDAAPATTGILAETFRRDAEVLRTASAFFSFAARGPLAEEVAALRPAEAWGDGSLYEWMEEKDAVCVMLGVPPTMCSFIHRAEWIERERIGYRRPKTVSGRIRLRGQEERLTETLFVRPDPLIINTFEPLRPALDRHGFKFGRLDGADCSAARCRDILAVAVPAIRSNPSMLTKAA